MPQEHLMTRPTIAGTVLMGLGILSLATSSVADDEPPDDAAVNLRLTLKDTNTGELVPGRITVEHHPGGGPFQYFFVESLDPEGSAVPYDVKRGPDSFEKHTTVSAHPFGANVPTGYYVIYYQHGPEWRGNKSQVWVKDGEVAELELPVSRWIDMNKRGWYSGDTHVHRTVKDLPNVMRAEDLNVALPLSYWIRDAYAPPVREDATFDESSELITVDPTRVIWPMNTEYELFTLNGRPHTQGAVFVLNHQQKLTLTTPPVVPVAEEARQQGALLDLDKHSWPWSMMLVPIMDVDLFELSNNHIWKTGFFFKNWTQEMRPQGWNIEADVDGFTEWGWIDFGFKSYYALLNCGFKMRPTAGTANGVHPVPLGYGRVYVECPDGFSYDNWMAGLDAGHSFVTTGPMLFGKVNDQPPGSTITLDGPGEVRVHGSVEGIHSLSRIEIIVNGDVVDVIMPENVYESPWVHRSRFDVTVPIERTSWVAVRCFEPHQSQPPWKMGFAHSSPVHIEVPGKPLLAKRHEVDYFIGRMDQELERNRDKLRSDELAEYRRAREIYERIGETAADESPVANEQLLSLALSNEDQRPNGWSLLDVSEGPFESLGSNPVVISHPILLDEVLEVTARDNLNEINVTRMMSAMYGSRSKSAVWLTTFVCADEPSAQRLHELLASRDRKLHSGRNGQVVVWLQGNSQAADETARETFWQQVEERLRSLVRRPSD